nr:hypothetical protein [uncultured Allomuricauda sp.]
MSGNILQSAREDVKKILSSGGFEEDITLSTPDGATTINTKGLATKHHITFEMDGPINSKNAHICIDESDIVDKNYVVRNNDGEVNLLNHRVEVSDNTGEKKKYLIKENFPNETLGLIICVLEDFVS